MPKTILDTSFCGTILIWNYFHWIRDHSENTIGRVEAFLFSPANSFPCHQVTSCHVISCHIMSWIRHVFRFYIVWRTYWFLPLWSGVVHTSWGKYALNLFASEGGAKKFGLSWLSTFFNHSGVGWKIFQASHWFTCQSPYI